jgi:predicted RNase H-like nuclease (RuvC/YqgF family)
MIVLTVGEIIGIAGFVLIIIGGLVTYAVKLSQKANKDYVDKLIANGVEVSQGLSYKAEGTSDKLDKFIDKVENKLKEQGEKQHQADITDNNLQNEINNLKNEINNLKNEINNLKNKSS